MGIQSGSILANARLIMSRPRFGQSAVRDGDLLGTVGGGIAAAAVFGWAASHVLEGWSLVAVVLAVAPLAVAVAWFVAGPTRLALQGDQLVLTHRTGSRSVDLNRLASVSREVGLRTVTLTFRDGRGQGLALFDLGDETQPFRSAIGLRLAALGLDHLARDKRTRVLLGLPQ